MIILASASPRRQQLLRYIIPDFGVVPSGVDETLEPGIPPQEAAELLALRKAQAVAAANPDDTVIGADTIVTLDGVLYGKPVDKPDAARILGALSGREHFVCTGVAVLSPVGRRVFVTETAVEFIELTAGQIEAYIATGEPMDKAGAYGVQGAGALFVRGIRGDFYGVVGLPVCRLAQELAALRCFDQKMS